MNQLTLGNHKANKISGSGWEQASTSISGKSGYTRTNNQLVVRTGQSSQSYQAGSNNASNHNALRNVKQQTGVAAYKVLGSGAGKP